MEKQIWKPGTLLAPVPPVLVSCGNLENSNILTIGWCGIINTSPAMTYISVRPQRHSYNIIKNSGEFIINLASADMVRQVDYCGVKSGAKTNKAEDCGFTMEAVENFTCPGIAQCQLQLCCKVKQIIPLGSHDMFLAEIHSVLVSEQLLDNNGKLHIERANLLAYAHGTYFELGKALGTFGFSVKKKSTRKRNYYKKPYSKNR